jgi:hypothetical protein
LTTTFYFRPLLLLVALFGAWLLLRDRLQGGGLFLVCWAAVPILTLALLGSTVAKATARYALCALPAVLLLAAVASVRVGEILARGHGGRGRLRSWPPALLLPVLLVVDMAAYDYHYFTVQHGDRARWREAASYLTRTAAGSRFTVFTVNRPSMLYYLRPQHHALRQDDPDPYPDREVFGILPEWVFGSTTDPVLPRIGGLAFLEGAIAFARSRERELFLVITLPELREIDADGSLEQALHERFVISRVYPVLVGPKDETIYVFRPATGR